MADIGLNQKITTGDREFHLQTSTLVDEGVIRTEVFEKGRVLFVTHRRFERRFPAQHRNADSRIRQVVDKFHQSIIEELDCLFEISDRLSEENSPVAHEKLGQVFLYSHIFDKAERHFKRAIALDPNRYSSHIYLSRSLFLQKRYHQSYEILDKLLKEKVAFPDLYNLLGMAVIKKNSYRLALQHYKKALQLNPTYLEAYYNFADAILHRLTLMKQPLEAAVKNRSLGVIRAILKKIARHGNIQDRKLSAQVMQALTKQDAGKAQLLLREFKENRFFKETPPEVIGFKFYLRLLYSEGEMSMESLESYERQISSALKDNPDYPDLWHYLALIHLMQCRHYFLQGLDNFREATRINPQFERAVKNLRLVENDGREFLSMIKSIM